MPDLSHLWQRFVLALTLVFGLAVGVAATVFGYSNTQPVDVRFSVFHITGVPLWSVGLVPVALVIAAGTLYHWWNGLHHFSEHMRHRRRVKELETEVTSLRSHLDHFLEIPDGTPSTAQPAPAASPVPSLPETEIVAAAAPESPVEAPPAETMATNGNGKSGKKQDRKATVERVAESDAAGADASIDAKVEDEMTSPAAPTAGS